MQNTACQRCPHCSGILPTISPAKTRKVSAPKSLDLHADTSAMSTAELFAYFKATAPAADLAFTLANLAPMSAALRAEFEALDPWGNRAIFYRQYNRLKDRRRAESVARDRADRLANGWTVDDGGFWQDPAAVDDDTAEEIAS